MIVVVVYITIPEGWEICFICKTIFPNYHGFDFILVITFIYYEISKNKDYVRFLGLSEGMGSKRLKTFNN